MSAFPPAPGDPYAGMVSGRASLVDGTTVTAFSTLGRGNYFDVFDAFSFQVVGAALSISSACIAI
ncbi:hypothetical protein [Desulfofustis glycolicus]|uniref:hypothetical protein n=1 Tax=Desulfofustis glycolicus TaxID=51195 RepID=UPI0011614D97|nr:hypothetical protein [Desulfofustis glycolicus]